MVRYVEVINKKTITELYKSQLTTSILFVISMFIVVGLASDRLVEIIHTLIKMSQAEKLVDESEAYALPALFFVMYCCLVVMLIFWIVRLVKILKDYEAMEKRNYVVFVGKVVKLKLYEHNGTIYNETPIVLNVATQEKFKIYLTHNEVGLGQTYEFNLLKNSKIAEVVRKVKNPQKFEQSKTEDI